MPYEGVVKDMAGIKQLVASSELEESNMLLVFGESRCRYMGALIQKSIEEKHKTQREFERAGGMRQGTAASVMKAKRGVNGAMFARIAKALGLPPKKFLAELDKAPAVTEAVATPGLGAPAGDVEEDAGGALLSMLQSMKLQDEPKLIVDVPHLGKIELGMASGRWAPVKKKKVARAGGD